MTLRKQGLSIYFINGTSIDSGKTRKSTYKQLEGHPIIMWMAFFVLYEGNGDGASRLTNKPTT